MGIGKELMIVLSVIVSHTCAVTDPPEPCLEGKLYPHDTKQSLYHVCDDGVKVARECPDGMFYNKHLGNCFSLLDRETEEAIQKHARIAINALGYMPRKIQTTTSTTNTPLTTLVTTSEPSERKKSKKQKKQRKKDETEDDTAYIKATNDNGNGLHISVLNLEVFPDLTEEKDSEESMAESLEMYPEHVKVAGAPEPDPQTENTADDDESESNDESTDEDDEDSETDEESDSDDENTDSDDEDESDDDDNSVSHKKKGSKSNQEETGNSYNPYYTKQIPFDWNRVEGDETSYSSKKLGQPVLMPFRQNVVEDNAANIMEYPRINLANPSYNTGNAGKNHINPYQNQINFNPQAFKPYSPDLQDGPNKLHLPISYYNPASAVDSSGKDRIFSHYNPINWKTEENSAKYPDNFNRNPPINARMWNQPALKTDSKINYNPYNDAMKPYMSNEMPFSPNMADHAANFNSNNDIVTSGKSSNRMNNPYYQHPSHEEKPPISYYNSNDLVENSKGNMYDKPFNWNKADDHPSMMFSDMSNRGLPNIVKIVTKPNEDKINHNPYNYAIKTNVGNERKMTFSGNRVVDNPGQFKENMPARPDYITVNVGHDKGSVNYGFVNSGKTTNESKPIYYNPVDSGVKLVLENTMPFQGHTSTPEFLGMDPYDPGSKFIKITDGDDWPHKNSHFNSHNSMKLNDRSGNIDRNPMRSNEMYQERNNPYTVPNSNPTPVRIPTKLDAGVVKSYQNSDDLVENSKGKNVQDNPFDWNKADDNPAIYLDKSDHDSPNFVKMVTKPTEDKNKEEEKMDSVNKINSDPYLYAMKAKVENEREKPLSKNRLVDNSRKLMEKISTKTASKNDESANNVIVNSSKTSDESKQIEYNSNESSMKTIVENVTPSRQKTSELSSVPNDVGRKYEKITDNNDHKKSTHSSSIYMITYPPEIISDLDPESLNFEFS